MDDHFQIRWKLSFFENLIVYDLTILLADQLLPHIKNTRFYVITATKHALLAQMPDLSSYIYICCLPKNVQFRWMLLNYPIWSTRFVPMVWQGEHHFDVFCVEHWMSTCSMQNTTCPPVIVHVTPISPGMKPSGSLAGNRDASYHA